MIVSTYQPYFAPYPGFFSKALRSDILVLLDTVQFPQGTSWLTRNRFKNDQGILRITIPVWKKGIGLQKINEVKICHEGRWAKKHLESLKTAYANAPYLKDHLTFLDKIFTEKFNNLIDFNLKIIMHLKEHLRIPTKVMLLSEMDIEAKEPELSVEICKKVGASHFMMQQGAKKHLDRDIFQKTGVELIFFNYSPIIYPQLWGHFIPNLSIFDLLFNYGPKSHDILIRG